MIQSINYCIDRAKTFCDQIQRKFQFWVLKLMNNHISETGDSSNISQISNEELNQSIDGLQKLLVIEQFSQAPNSLRCFLLKTAYELGYHYYLKNNSEKMNFYFLYCVNNFHELKNFPILKSIYFERENLIKILQIAEKNSFLCLDKCEEDFSEYNKKINDDEKIQEKNVNVIIDRKVADECNNDMEVEKEIAVSENIPNPKMKLNLEKESIVIESDFANLFNKISIKSQDKAIIDVNNI